MKIVIIAGLALAAIAATTSSITAWNTAPSKQKANIAEVTGAAPIVALAPVKK